MTAAIETTAVCAFASGRQEATDAGFGLADRPISPRLGGKGSRWQACSSAVHSSAGTRSRNACCTVWSALAVLARLG